MNDLTSNFGELYFPVKAFVLFCRQSNDGNRQCYVESYDMDASGTPLNAHPLSEKESSALAKALSAGTKKEAGFLKPEGLLPNNLLYLNGGQDAFAIWHSPPQAVKLLFEDDLTIPNGTACIPPLVWKADKASLRVFAVKDKKPGLKTALYHAPFFNLNADGRVCMGNVNIKIPKDCGLENFMRLWQSYFFESYFTHLLGGFNPVAGNIVQLWQSLVNTSAKFPLKLLISNKRTLQHLLP